MKALTLFQPWASLVVYGFKHIETRSWRTAYRGPLVIHASKNATFMPRLLFLLAQGAVPPEVRDLPFPTGALLAYVQLVNCGLAMAMLRHYGGSPTEEALGDYAPGRYGWVMERPQPFPHPLPCKGALGLWQVPGDITMPPPPPAAPGPQRILSGGCLL